MRALTRANVTAASRVMLPIYVVFFTIIGCSLTFTPQRRLHETPTFRYADRWLDLDWWGIGFLLLAAWLAVALIRRDRPLARYALAAAVVWFAGYSILAAVSAFTDRASFAAWAWPAFVAVACWASLTSLTTGEIGEPR